MQKRGLSPLIAVVLIIGFTVAIAAIIMTWGTGFVRGVQKTTEETAEKELTLAVEAMLDIRRAELIGNKIKLTVENTGSQEIKNIKVRIYGAEGIDTVSVAGLGAYGVSVLSAEFDPSKTGIVEKVEAMPVIEYAGELVVCTNCAGDIKKIRLGETLLKNPGFESGLDYWVANDPNVGGLTFETVTDPSLALFGSSYLKINIPDAYSDAWPGVRQDPEIPIESNTEYIYSVWIYIPSTTTIDGTWELHRHVYTIDLCGTSPPYNCHHYTILEGDWQWNDLTEKGKWIYKWIKIRTAADGVSFRPFILGMPGPPGGSGVTYADGVQFYKA